MNRKWMETVINRDSDVSDRMFRLLTAISVVILTFLLIYGSLLDESFLYLAALMVSIVSIMLVTAVSIKIDRVNVGAVLVAMLLIGIFVLNFFVGGGMYGGAPVQFVFCFVYVAVVLSGKCKVFFCLFSAALTVVSYYLAYHNPQFVVPHSTRHAYLNSEGSVIVVGILISMVVSLQNYLYEEQNKVTTRQKKEIEELNQAEKRFFSSMSHEIRTPINTIIGLNEMILRADVSDEVAENARNINGASKMLLSLINDILDLSKIESGKMEIVNVSYQTGEMFSDIVNMIRIKAKEKGLTLHLNIDPSIPKALLGDEVRIKQILINLMNNAVKYTPSGSISLSVRCDRVSEKCARMYYSVADTGMGIKKESIAHLFDAFSRVDTEKNRYIEGSGLGLSIVKQLIELMDGEISVNSIYTEGSTFHVTLEQKIVDGTELGPFSLGSGAGVERTQYEQSFEAPKAQLLIVDDNEMNLLVAKKLLSATKVQIETAKSGAECLKLTQERQFDGILMDHLMPGMDGIECLHLVRAQKGGMCKNTPVIALTANAGSESRQLYRKEGFNGYLSKPVSGATLEEAVLNMLPEKLVTLNRKSQGKLGTDVLMFDEGQRVSLTITTDSVSDLPGELTEKLGIFVQPYYVCTKEGRFLDEQEIGADELLKYLSAGGEGHSKAPSVEDYERFFAKRLTQAHHIIHITMAKNASDGFQNASEAAMAFENVTVIDSGHLSSSLGLAVLYAASMARNNATKEEILDMLEGLKKRIESAFIIDSTDMLCRAGKIPKSVHTICNALLIHPVIVLRKSRMTVGGIHFGSTEQVTKSYIQKVLKNKDAIDTRILFITYAGMDEQGLSKIREIVDQCCSFERIYLQRASSAIASNCGPGSFGLLFLHRADYERQPG